MLTLQIMRQTRFEIRHDGITTMDALAIQAALTIAMQHSTAPMVLCDPHLPDTPMVAVNPAFSALTGYPTDEIIGRNCRFLQGPRTDPVSPPRIRACLASGQGCIEWIVNYRRDGSHFYNLLFISPVRDTSGTLLFYFGNQLDITMGTPAWLSEVSFGSANLIPAQEAEFHKVLKNISVKSRTKGLEEIVAGAHRLAEISIRLEPGTLEAFSFDRQ
jgi:PAS domain S-box-containing protein